MIKATKKSILSIGLTVVIASLVVTAVIYAATVVDKTGITTNSLTVTGRTIIGGPWKDIEQDANLYISEAHTPAKLVIEAGQSGNYNSILKLHPGGSGLALIEYGGSYGNDIQFRSFNSKTIDVLRITDDGKIGIGTTAPDTNFHLSASRNGNTVPGIRIENPKNEPLEGIYIDAYVGGESAGDPVFRTYIKNSHWWSWGIDNSEENKFKISQSSGLGTNDRLTITTGGNVGIGTTSPTSKLHVTGTPGYGTVVLIDGDSSMGGLQVNSTRADGAPSISLTRQNLDKASIYVSPSDNSLIFRIAGTDKIKITSDGKMAIGQHTASNPLDPKTELDVNGIIRTKPRSSATCSTDTEGGIYYDSDDKHFYGCNGSSWIRLDD